MQLVISANSWELAQCYMERGSKVLLQKFVFFPKQDCFHRCYWKSMSLHQEKQFPDKGTSAAGTAQPAQSTSIIAV